MKMVIVISFLLTLFISSNAQYNVFVDTLFGIDTVYYSTHRHKSEISILIHFNEIGGTSDGACVIRSLNSGLYRNTLKYRFTNNESYRARTDTVSIINGQHYLYYSNNLYSKFDIALYGTRNDTTEIRIKVNQK